MACGFLLLACLVCPSRLLADIVYVWRYHNTKGLVKAEVVSSNVALHLLIPTNYWRSLGLVVAFASLLNP